MDRDAKSQVSASSVVAPTCEVIVQWTEPPVYCGAPTANWYPAMGGTMALCEQHAQKHLPHGAFPYKPASSLSSASESEKP